MEKIKNFLYDKSDLFVALLIVAIAGLVIWFGINNIMEPVTEDPTTKTTAQVTEETTTTDSGVDTNSDNSNAADNSTNAEDKKASENSGSPKEVKIIISAGETNDQVAEKLLVDKAISSKADFMAKLQEMGLETKVNQGTFTIPAGSSLEQICKIITRT